MGTDEKSKLTPSCDISEGNHKWTQRTGVAVCSKPQPRTVLCSLHKLLLSLENPPQPSHTCLSCTKACQISCTSCAVLPLPVPSPPQLRGRMDHPPPAASLTHNPSSPWAAELQPSSEHPPTWAQLKDSTVPSLQGEGGDPAPALTNLLIKNLGRA